MDVIVLIGRILFGLLPVGAALGGHFGATDETAGYAEARGVSGARPLVLLSGAQLLVAGLSIILGIWPDLGALLFGLFTLASAFMIHHFWTDEGETRQMEMSHFMKNMSLTGAALIAFAYFVTVGEAAPFQITDNLFDL